MAGNSDLFAIHARGPGRSVRPINRTREAARLFAKILGELESRGAADVVPMLEAALATGTPLIVARPAAQAAVAAVAVPSSLREVDVRSGCAADYDAWLTGVPA